MYTKRKLLTWLVAICLFLGCMTGVASGEAGKKDATAPDTASATYAPVRAATYTSDAHGISFQYPEDWFLLDKEMIGEVDLAALEEAGLTVSEEQLEMMMQSMEALFYDLSRSNMMMAANFNFVVGESGGLSAELLSNEAMMAQIVAMFDQQYSAMFGNFSWVQEPALVEMGDHTVLQYIVEYEMSQVAIQAYQVLMFNGAELYTFTYSVAGAYADDALYTLLEDIIATVTFE